MRANPRGGIATLVPVPARHDTLPLSRSKLHPPRLPAHLVAIDRQRQWVDPVLRHAITIVRAPAGYGKSIFCASLYALLQEKGCGLGWVSFDSHLTSAQSARYIAAAIWAACGREVGDIPPDFDEARAPIAAAVETANAVHQLSRPLVLFLDDVHRITDGWNVDFIDHLIQHCPPDLHLVMTCPGEPPSFVRDAERRGIALHVDMDDLRLSDLEVAEYLASSGLFPDDAQIAELNGAMAGWVGGLKIVTGALRQMPIDLVRGNWEARCAAWLKPYFDGALDRLEPRSLLLLIRGAVAKVLTPGLCAELTGDSDAGEVLERLCDDGVFVHRLASGLGRYQLHPAFRAFLTARLLSQDTRLIPELRRRASAWHAENGMVAEAVDFALDAQDFAAAAALLALEVVPVIERLGPLRVRAMLDRLPARLIAADINLQRADAWTSALCGSRDAENALDRLRVTAGAAGQLQDWAAEFAAIEAACWTIRKDRPDEGLFRATALLAGSRDNDFATRLTRSLAAYAELRRGDHKRAHEVLRPVMLGARARCGFAEAIGYSVTAALYRAQGRVADADRVLREGLARTEQMASENAAATALLAGALAHNLYHGNDVASAACLIEAQLPVLEHVGTAETAIQALTVAIRVAASHGRADEAAGLIEQAELIAFERGWLPMLAMCAVERARLRLPPTIDLEEIVAIEDEEAAIADPLSAAARAFALLSEARAYEAIANNDRPRLTLVADRLLRLSEAANDVEMRIRASLFNILPQLSGRCGRMVEIDTVKFLNNAANAGFIRTIVDILEVTGVHTSQDFRSEDYSGGSFLALLRLAQPAQPDAALSSHEGGAAFSFLTSREIEIVTALNIGETNKTIARQLGLTPETIKWHLKNLMRKLRANSRGEVVRNAATLGLSLTKTGVELPAD
jgi:LuxR family maltose regulon positive regulatory protein